MDPIFDWLEGFATWQTPLSFLAGIGVHHLYAKYYRDRKAKFSMMMYRKNGTEYHLTFRFWVVVVVASLVIGFIGWRTQDTANRVEAQAQETAQFAKQTNDCQNQLIGTLNDRTTLNAQLDDLVNRRTIVWTKLVTGLAVIDPSLRTPERDVLAKTVLDEFFTDSAAIDQERAALLRQRTENPYPEPNCGQNVR